MREESAKEIAEWAAHCAGMNQTDQSMCWGFLCWRAPFCVKSGSLKDSLCPVENEPTIKYDWQE